jgi:hypothetical protein
MRKFASITVLAALALGLAACGGSGNNAFVPPPTNPGSTVSSIAVTTSTATIPSDGSASATITTHATDANNSAVSGATVTFSSSAGTISGSPATTDANGNATATLAAGTAAAGTAITVTATSGSGSGTAKVTVSNSQQTITLETDEPQIPSDGLKPATITALVRDANNNFVSGVAITFKSTSGGLTVVNGTTDTNGAATATLNAASDPTNRTITVTASAGQTSATLDVPVVGTALSVTGAPSLVIGSQGTYNVSLTDSSGKPIAGQSVALTSSAGNTLSAASVTTDVSGHATLQLTAAKAGTDTLTAKTLGLTATQTVVVSGQSFVFTSPAANTKVDLGASLTLIVNWKSTGTPQVGQTVNFASTRGILAPASAVTDASGNATVHISSTTSGPAIISATGTGVTATLAVDFVATNPTALDLQANPATIAIQGQSTISAIVRDPANNLVEGQTVSFQLTDITGGSLSVASAQTDIQGRAQTVYTASSAPSASNGVTVTAIVQGKPAVTGSATLTVGGQTVFLSLGTGVKLQENAPATQFTMPWVLQAVDSAGNPVNNVPVTLTIHSVSYYKGTWVAAGSAWVWTPTSPACANEDVNLNGVLDPGEDFNGNHKLDPGEVAVTTVGTVTTAADGSATFGVEYPEDHAVWVIVNLTATANVQGTQASTNSIFQLPMLSSYVTTAPSAIPGEVSPYGVNVSCANPN